MVFFIFNSATKAQIIIQSFNLVVPCCADSDSIDIKNDGLYDIKIISGSGFDAVEIDNKPIQTNMVQVTNNPIDSGSLFQFYNPYGGLIAQTSIICDWNSMWYPNTGNKYVGFRMINAPNDTTFGWLEFNFRGDAASCSDTVYGIKLGYNSIPNVHLFAGETSTTNVDEITDGGYFEVYPNPMSDNLTLNIGDKLLSATAKIFNSLGEIKYCAIIMSTKSNIDVSNLPEGFYVLEVSSNNKVSRQKLIRQYNSR
jgi:hypothetical protein